MYSLNPLDTERLRAYYGTLTYLFATATGLGYVTEAHDYGRQAETVAFICTALGYDVQTDTLSGEPITDTALKAIRDYRLTSYHDSQARHTIASVLLLCHFPLQEPPSLRDRPST